MRAYTSMVLRLFLKEGKNRLMMGLFMVFLIVVGFMIYSQGVGELEREQYQELNANRVASGVLSEAVLNQEGTTDLYDNFFTQSSLVARQDLALTMNDSELFMEATLELNELQEDIIHSDVLEQLDESVTHLLPTEYEVMSEQVLYAAIDEQNLSLMTDRQNAGGYLITFMEYFGPIAAAFLLLYSSSILTTDLDHQTMVESYPLTVSQKVRGKLGVYTLSSVGIVTVLTCLAYIGMGLFTVFDNQQYPMVLYNAGSFQAVPLWQFIFLYLVYFSVLAIHMITLSALLNVWLKHTYATLFAGLFLCFLPFIIQTFLPGSSVLSWLPSTYYTINGILSGKTASTYGSSIMSVTNGIVYLILWTLFFFGILSFVQKIRQSKIERQSTT